MQICDAGGKEELVREQQGKVDWGVGWVGTDMGVGWGETHGVVGGRNFVGSVGWGGSIEGVGGSNQGGMWGDGGTSGDFQ